MTLLGPDTVPRLWRLARLEYDPVRQKHVLLYPEGAVLLNDTGAAILELCNGTRTVDEIVTILTERYHADVSADVNEYLSQMADRELVRDG
jgi:pyrroloquinoline quinone biosynthesis protein D